MKKIWWTWDIRMRWAPGFSFTAKSYEDNYRALIDVAPKYGVEGVVIWGFLRDTHGGIDSALRICEYARNKGIAIIPGVGIDHYGGVYYDGESPYSLDYYLKKHPEAQAIDMDGNPFTFKWPATDHSSRAIACPSNVQTIDYYKESVEWLIKTFDLEGIQIEQGDNGLCYCKHCQRNRGVLLQNGKTDFTMAVKRMVPVIEHALSVNQQLTVISETYSGITAAEIAPLEKALSLFPSQVYISWQVYLGSEGIFKIDKDSRSKWPHGCLAVRTNNDAALGEFNDSDNIRKIVQLGKNAGLDMTYLYGEYPDRWPDTRINYEAWAAATEGDL
jgi:hypothetical protein